ncbi:3-isopropylmalate dehydratase [Halomarina halobia]|uniref:3-isopropylmalate dehydratase small subunit n=1 Tax=Halomarina halobia TaxID=3033386 RepID=A0ABD6AE02_9EURY|nr:3-isopropylmalate dehydratase [Halomarina sp. PSR21]
MRGVARVFGDDVNTDVITPSDYFGEPLAVMAQHVFEPERPEFVSTIDAGDIVVAGDRFGSGSSRESAPAAIQAAGIGAVVAESFARIFYRNAVAIGLPAVTCPGVTGGVSEGDEIAVDIGAGTVRNCTTGERFESESLPPEVQSIFDRGGLIELYRTTPGELRLE